MYQSDAIDIMNEVYRRCQDVFPAELKMHISTVPMPEATLISGKNRPLKEVAPHNRGTEPEVEQDESV